MDIIDDERENNPSPFHSAMINQFKQFNKGMNLPLTPSQFMKKTRKCIFNQTSMDKENSSSLANNNNSNNSVPKKTFLLRKNSSTSSNGISLISSSAAAVPPLHSSKPLEVGNNKQLKLQNETKNNTVLKSEQQNKHFEVKGQANKNEKEKDENQGVEIKSLLVQDKQIIEEKKDTIKKSVSFDIDIKKPHNNLSSSTHGGYLRKDAKDHSNKAFKEQGKGDKEEIKRMSMSHPLPSHLNLKNDKEDDCDKKLDPSLSRRMKINNLRRNKTQETRKESNNSIFSISIPFNSEEPVYNGEVSSLLSPVDTTPNIVNRRLSLGGKMFSSQNIDSSNYFTPRTQKTIVSKLDSVNKRNGELCEGLQETNTMLEEHEKLVQDVVELESENVKFQEQILFLMNKIQSDAQEREKEIIERERERLEREREIEKERERERKEREKEIKKMEEKDKKERETERAKRDEDDKERERERKLMYERLQILEEEKEKTLKDNEKERENAWQVNERGKMEIVNHFNNLLVKEKMKMNEDVENTSFYFEKLMEEEVKKVNEKSEWEMTKVQEDFTAKWEEKERLNQREIEIITSQWREKEKEYEREKEEKEREYKREREEESKEKLALKLLQSELQIEVNNLLIHLKNGKEEMLALAVEVERNQMEVEVLSEEENKKVLEISQLNSQLDEANASIQSQNHELINLRASSHASVVELEAKVKSMATNHENEMLLSRTQLEESINMYEQMKNHFEEMKSNADLSIIQKNEEIERLIVDQYHLEENLKERACDLVEARKEMTDLKDEMANAFQSKDDQLAALAIEMQTKISEAVKEQQLLQDQLSKVQTQNKELLFSLSTCENQKNDVKDQLEMVTRDLSESSAIQSNTMKLMKSLEAEINSLNLQVSQMQHEKEALITTNLALTNDKISLQNQVSAFNSELIKMREEKETQISLNQSLMNAKCTLESEVDFLKAELLNCKAEHEEEKAMLVQSVSDSQGRQQANESQLEEMERFMHQAGQEMNILRDEQLKMLRQQQMHANKMKVEIENLHKENISLKSNLANRETDLKINKEEMESLLLSLTNENNALSEQVNHMHDVVKENNQIKSEMSMMSAKMLKDSEVRRALHEEVCDLKGNIRVLCRVRPLSKMDEKTNTTNSSVDFHYPDSHLEGQTIDLIEPSALSVDGCREVSKCHSFSYNRVFDQFQTQDEVFSEVLPLIQSAIDGSKVCIFAYGQTGSGKTYTMQGEGEECIDVKGETRGIIPRAFEHIFDFTNSMKSDGWTFTFTIQILEIYNENIFDLLSSSESQASGKDTHDKEAVKLDIKMVSVHSDEVYVPNSQIFSISNIQEAVSLLEIAGERRMQNATDINNRSSRSHCLFTLKIKGSHPTLRELNGQLNLIDLAGSERLSLSGSCRDDVLMKETQCINKSLACLSNVISALQQKNKHVPFRDSKLTHLLQSSLSNNAKTLMIVNISPTLSSMNESINSLRFANKVNSVEISKKNNNLCSKCQNKIKEMK